MSNPEQLIEAAVEEPNVQAVNRLDSETTKLGAQAPQFPDGERPGEKRTADDQTGSRVSTRRGTGPRTPIGKERSKYNALKHGLFAKVVVMSHESSFLFDNLLRGLRDDLMPVGVLEGALVEKLATIFWRYRRLLQAESAEILKNVEDQEKKEEDEGTQREVEAELLEEYQGRTFQHGLIEGIDDPGVFEFCLSRLRQELTGAGIMGLDFKKPPSYLGLFYGARYAGRPGKDLYDHYLRCAKAFNASATDAQRETYSTDNASAQEFLAELRKEIHRLEGLRKYPPPKAKRKNVKASLQPTRTQLLKCAIPDSDRLDRLLRYETGLERALERTLIQFERLRRSRDSQKTILLNRQMASSE